MHYREFIALKLGKEEVTFTTIKGNQSFHQRKIFIKMEKPLLILMRMVDLNQPHMENLWFIVLMVDYHIRISMYEINDEEYFPPVTEL